MTFYQAHSGKLLVKSLFAGALLITTQVFAQQATQSAEANSVPAASDSSASSGNAGPMRQEIQDVREAKGELEKPRAVRPVEMDQMKAKKEEWKQARKEFGPGSSQAQEARQKFQEQRREVRERHAQVRKDRHDLNRERHDVRNMRQERMERRQGRGN